MPCNRLLLGITSDAQRRLAPVARRILGDDAHAVGGTVPGNPNDAGLPDLTLDSRAVDPEEEPSRLAHLETDPTSREEPDARGGRVDRERHRDRDRAEEGVAHLEDERVVAVF